MGPPATSPRPDNESTNDRMGNSNIDADSIADFAALKYGLQQLVEQAFLFAMPASYVSGLAKRSCPFAPL
jgi:hypothetical protein